LASETDNTLSFKHLVSPKVYTKRKEMKVEFARSAVRLPIVSSG